MYGQIAYILFSLLWAWTGVVWVIATFVGCMFLFGVLLCILVVRQKEERRNQ
jgi:protein-S-isoprenylcysteine O-methyltransferase Ste14